MTYTCSRAAAALAALFVLGACTAEPVVVGETFDPQAEALKNAAPVALPPSIKVARTYRCKDNSLVHISFLSDDVTAVIRDREGGEPPRATLKAPTAGQPFTAEGYSVNGGGETITYKSPQRGAQSCRS